MNLNLRTARQPLTPDEHFVEALRVHTALRQIVEAKAARVEEWRDLADAANVLEALCDLRKIKDAEVWLYRIGEVNQALREARENYPDGQMCVADDLHAQFLKEIVSKYDVAIGKLSRGTLQEAIEHVKRKISRARANANDGVIVVE